jgi:ParB/RepB/Spo0J family partition protein
MPKKGSRKKQALSGARFDGFLMNPDELVIVGLDTDDGPEHPLFDPKIRKPLVEARVLNVMRYGVKETIVVRKNGDKVEVVDGRTRVRWARQANARFQKSGEEQIRVPARVVKCDDEEAHDLMICLNEVREDENPIERAKKLQRLKERGRTEKELGVIFGIGPKTVEKQLALLDLNSDVQAKVAAGELGIGEGVRLAQLPREAQTKAAVERVTAREKGEKPAPLPGEKTPRPSKKDVLKLADHLGGVTGAALRWALAEAYDKGLLDPVLYGFQRSGGLPANLMHLSGKHCGAKLAIGVAIRSSAQADQVTCPYCVMELPSRICRSCGATSLSVKKRGGEVWWLEPDLCSAESCREKAKAS